MGERIEVGVAGDSWAAGQKLDGGIGWALRAAGLDPRVRSRGLPGARSRRVRAELERELMTGGLLTPRWVAARPRGCLVIASGVNDAFGHVGPADYARQVAGMVQLGLARELTVAVVRIPYVNLVDRRWDRGRPLRWLRRWALDGGDRGPGLIDRYNNELDGLVAPAALLVDPPLGDLLGDGLHLTPLAYVRLGYRIGEALAGRLLPGWVSPNIRKMGDF
jgi:hypothetical protein